MEERSPRIRHVPNPCEPDCPERTSDCHGGCKRYARYYDYNRLKDEARRSKFDIEALEHQRHIQKSRRCYNNE